MHKHEWHEEREDGDTRYVRALFHAGRWAFEDTLKSQETWTRHKTLPLADLTTLREILWNKYQRARVPHGHVKYIDRLIAEAGGENANGERPDRKQA
jgi:hypothetical protein